MARPPNPYTNNAQATSGRAIDDERLLSGAYWDELRTFLGLAKARSINRAAEVLGLSKSTISRQIKRLQDQHDGNLALLTKTGFRPTEDGERLLKLLLDFDEAISSIRTNASAHAEQFRGTVRLSVTDGLGALFVVPALRHFMQTYPDISIRFKPPRNMTSLRENQTDVMLGFSQQAGSGITSARLGTLHLIPIASRSYIERYGEPHLGNLGEHDFIDTERYSARGGPWDEWHGLVSQARIVHEADTIISYAMMVKAGLGIGLLASCNVLEPSAVPLKIGSQVALPIYMTVLSDRLAAGPVRAVFDYLAELFDPSVPWFASDLRLNDRGTSADEGYALLFNLGQGDPAY